MRSTRQAGTTLAYIFATTRNLKLNLKKLKRKREIRCKKPEFRVVTDNNFKLYRGNFSHSVLDASQCNILLQCISRGPVFAE